jgi:hypothetical protein
LVGCEEVGVGFDIFGKGRRIYLEEMRGLPRGLDFGLYGCEEVSLVGLMVSSTRKVKLPFP